MHRPLEVEMCGQRRQVVSVMIHVMSAAGLGGAAVAAPVVGDHAEALAEEEQHLRVPIVGREGPAMAENDRLPCAPILIENLGAVLGGDRAHGRSFPMVGGGRERPYYFGDVTDWVSTMILPAAVTLFIAR